MYSKFVFIFIFISASAYILCPTSGIYVRSFMSKFAYKRFRNRVGQACEERLASSFEAGRSVRRSFQANQLPGLFG